MIAIATGIDALDKKVEELFNAGGITDIQIVNYREFLIQQPFNTVIMSKNLVGSVELEFLVLSLRERNTRIIYLTNEKDLHELKTCLDYGIYDLIFDPISPDAIINVYNVPKTFADVKKIFMIVNSPDNKQKSKDIEKLNKMKDNNYVGLIQNRAEYFDAPTQAPSNQVQGQAQTPNYGGVQGGGYSSQDAMSAQNMGPSNTPHMDSSSAQMPYIPSMNNAPQQSAPMPSGPAPSMPDMPQMPSMQPQPQQAQPQMQQAQPQVQQQVVPNFKTEEPTYYDEQREVMPLAEDNFPQDKKRVIRETQIESVYQIPGDYKKTIVLLSPESSGKTTTAINMAWYYAKHGIKTTLIDTDLRKKDIYYSFPIDTAECLSKISSTEDVTKLGIPVHKNLKVYTEHKDVQVSFELYDLVKLITASKRISQVVIVDLDWNLDSEMIKNVLEIADNILVVVDQKVTTLNRVPEELYTYRNQLQSIDLVVNRFYNIKHLEKDRVADFFREIEIYNGKTFDIRVNRTFTISDDAKSVLQGLAERIPAIDIRDNIIEEDVAVLCDSLFSMGENKKKFLL